jgi:hypothetical protein
VGYLNNAIVRSEVMSLSVANGAAVTVYPQQLLCVHDSSKSLLQEPFTEVFHRMK